LSIPTESKRPAEQREATNSPVDCLLGRGRFHLCPDMAGTAVDGHESFSAIHNITIPYGSPTNPITKNPSLCDFITENTGLFLYDKLKDKNKEARL